MNQAASKVLITYTPHPDTTPEGELNALAAVLKFVLFDSQAVRGGLHDLMSKTTTEHIGKRTTKQTEKEKT